MTPYTIDKHISWMCSQILKTETSPERDICSQLLEHTSPPMGISCDWRANLHRKLSIRQWRHWTSIWESAKTTIYLRIGRRFEDWTSIRDWTSIWVLHTERIIAIKQENLDVINNPWKCSCTFYKIGNIQSALFFSSFYIIENVNVTL